MSGGWSRRRALLMAAAAAAAQAATQRRGSASDLPPPGDVLKGHELAGQEASWYKRLDDRRIECQLCPRGCRVADAERGACGVRENRRGTYDTLVHSLPCTFHVDPIEKKPFFHVLPGANAFSWATAGCNVECKFCQNWEISQFRPEQVRSFSMPPAELVAAAQRAAVPLLTATYSEPVVFWEFVRDTASAALEHGLRTTVVTNGYIQERPLREVLPLLAAVKVDLKAFSDSFYRDVVRGELKPVLHALEVIRGSGVWLEIVVLLIPTLNDSDLELQQMARWIRKNLGSEVPVHFTRYHPTYRLTNLPPTPIATLERASALARSSGLKYVYLGNVPGHDQENTYCPSCRKRLIRRVGFQVLENRLASGRCPDCGQPQPGVWS